MDIKILNRKINGVKKKKEWKRGKIDRNWLEQKELVSKIGKISNFLKMYNNAGMYHKRKMYK